MRWGGETLFPPSLSLPCQKIHNEHENLKIRKKEKGSSSSSIAPSTALFPPLLDVAFAVSPPPLRLGAMKTRERWNQSISCVMRLLCRQSLIQYYYTRTQTDGPKVLLLPFFPLLEKYKKRLVVSLLAGCSCSLSLIFQSILGGGGCCCCCCCWEYDLARLLCRCNKRERSKVGRLLHICLLLLGGCESPLKKRKEKKKSCCLIVMPRKREDNDFCFFVALKTC